MVDNLDFCKTEALRKYLEEVDMSKFLSDSEIIQYFSEEDHSPKRAAVGRGEKREHLIYQVIDLTEDDSFDGENEIELSTVGSPINDSEKNDVIVIDSSAGSDTSSIFMVNSPASPNTSDVIVIDSSTTSDRSDSDIDSPDNSSKDCYIVTEPCTPLDGRGNITLDTSVIMEENVIEISNLIQENPIATSSLMNSPTSSVRSDVIREDDSTSVSINPPAFATKNSDQCDQIDLSTSVDQTRSVDKSTESAQTKGTIVEVKEINIIIEQPSTSSNHEQIKPDQNIYTVQFDEKLYILIDTGKKANICDSVRPPSCSDKDVQVSILRSIPDYSIKTKEYADGIAERSQVLKRQPNVDIPISHDGDENGNNENGNNENGNFENGNNENGNNESGNNEDLSRKDFEMDQDVNYASSNEDVAEGLSGDLPEFVYPLPYEEQMDTTEDVPEEEMIGLEMSQEAKLYLLEKYQNTWAQLSKKDMVYAKAEDELEVLYEDGKFIIYRDKIEDGIPQYDVKISDASDTEERSSEDLLNMLFRHLRSNNGNKDGANL